MLIFYSNELVASSNYTSFGTITGGDAPPPPNRRYDPAGNVTATTDARGQRIEYVYDVMNRLVKKILPGGHEINYVYDAAGNLLEVTDRIGTTRYEYDAGNRLTKAGGGPHCLDILKGVLSSESCAS